MVCGRAIFNFRTAFFMTYYSCFYGLVYRFSGINREVLKIKCFICFRATNLNLTCYINTNINIFYSKHIKISRPNEPE